MPTHNEPNSYEFILPIEWVEEHFDNGYDIEEVSFGTSALQNWVDEHPGFIYLGSSDTSFRTEDHDVPEYEERDLVCLRCTFERVNNSNSPYRSKRRVNIGNTKVPLPKDITT